MKKKSLALIICAAFVVVALAVSLIFVFSGAGKEPEKEPSNTVSLPGTWVVVASFTGDVPTYTDGQFMIFTNNHVALYKDPTGEAYAESDYTLNESGKMKLPDLSREYRVDRKSENCVRLYENASTYLLLVRNSQAERKLDIVSTEHLQGKWDVIAKGNEYNRGEVLEINGTTLKYFKDPTAEPYATSEFILDGNKLVAEKLGMNVKCYKADADTVILVQEDGNIWELTK